MGDTDHKEEVLRLLRAAEHGLDVPYDGEPEGFELGTLGAASKMGLVRNQSGAWSSADTYTLTNLGRQAVGMATKPWWKRLFI